MLSLLFTRPFVALNTSVSRNVKPWEAECCRTCGCNPNVWKPVCHLKTNTIFSSPCYAGCFKGPIFIAPSNQVNSLPVCNLYSTYHFLWCWIGKNCWESSEILSFSFSFGVFFSCGILTYICIQSGRENLAKCQSAMHAAFKLFSFSLHCLYNHKVIHLACILSPYVKGNYITFPIIISGVHF